MTWEETLAKPTSREARSLLERHRVRCLFLVGSHAQGETGGGRDLDCEPGAPPVSLGEFFPTPTEELVEAYLGLILGLEALLGCHVDLTKASAVQKPFVRESFLKHGWEIYGG